MENNSRLKEFIKYASLNVLGMLGLSCYILADTFFVSKGLGANGLAALNIAIPVYSFIHGCGLMFGMGGATRFSIFRSQKKQKNSNYVFTNTVCITLFTAMVFVLAGVFLSGKITLLLGADEIIFSMTNTYLKVILLFAPAFMMNDVMLCFVRNDGNPRLSMYAMLIGSMSNIVLDYIFIFPMKMGIFGAVFATGIAALISLLILSPHWLKKTAGFRLVKTKLQWRLIGGSMSLGFPSLVTEVASGIVMITFNTIILGLAGNVGVAAYGVIANLSLVVTAIYTGIAQGSQPLFCRAYGSGDKAGIKAILRYAVAATVAVSAVIYAVVFLFADPITGVFNSGQNAQLQEIASYGLRIYFTAVLFVGFNIVLSVYFTSTENAIPAHIISILRGLVIIVPMAFVLSRLLELTGVWMAFPVTELAVASLGLGIFRFTRPKGG